MHKIYSSLARGYFLAATLTLLFFAAALLVGALWEVVVVLISATSPVNAALDAIGLLIIGFAVVETAKFIAEEEILRERELRSPRESRRSLTKFITIIVIAVSLEALVMTFKTSQDHIPHAIYPAMLFIAASIALVALGLYQWFSAKVQTEPPQPKEPAPKD